MRTWRIGQIGPRRLGRLRDAGPASTVFSTNGGAPGETPAFARPELLTTALADRPLARRTWLFLIAPRTVTQRPRSLPGCWFLVPSLRKHRGCLRFREESTDIRYLNLQQRANVSIGLFSRLLASLIICWNDHGQTKWRQEHRHEHLSPIKLCNHRLILSWSL